MLDEAKSLQSECSLPPVQPMCTLGAEPLLFHDMLRAPEDSNESNRFLSGHRKYHPMIINCPKQFVYLLVMFKPLIQLNSSVDTLLVKYTSCLVG